MEVTTLQSEDAFGGGRGVDNSMVAPSKAIGGSKEGAGMEKSFPPPLLGKEQMAPFQVQSPTVVALEAQDPLPRAVVEESAQAVPAPSLSLSSLLEALILSIYEDVKKGFANSEVNQGEIREVCAILERKIDCVMERTQALEEAMGGMKEELAQHKGEIDALKGSEQALKNRIEQLENYSRRNNLKLLKVPEGTEGNDLKAFVVSLIKSTVGLEETEEEIGKEIQGFFT
ncbi:hypothetical protein NDU88_000140 [Pleurodeles waltl]|uniref:Uncharacterized protein n=1 Tax=Pleurodeles waltl TaxID=8319 RepID=A0AAV7WHN1_PLEWA|nr:hypothetical protein NDU88_000140 [Pleurodeles waltl]